MGSIIDYTAVDVISKDLRVKRLYYSMRVSVVGEGLKNDEKD